MSETAERLYQALLYYERLAAGLEAQTNSGPPFAGYLGRETVEKQADRPDLGYSD
jgi:hypothetical protein